MSGFGNVLSAIGGIVQGIGAHNIGVYNNRVAKWNAQNALQDAAAQEGDVREQVRSAIGQQLVSQGSSGFQMGTGTHLDALVESQVNGMLDELRIRRQGAMQAQAYRQQGQLAKMQAKSAEIGSYFGAAKSAYDAYKDYSSG